MDSPAIRKYRRLKAEVASLSGPKLEKALRDLEVLGDIIRTQTPGFTFDETTHEPDRKSADLAKAIEALQERLHKADAWFADPANANHPRFQEFGHAADQISREMGDLTGKAYAMGLYWDGQRLIPWADAFNPAAMPGMVATLTDGKTAEPFTGTQVQNLDDLE